MRPDRRNHYLFVSSDLFWPGGIAQYIDTLTRALVSLGDTVKMLAVVRPDEKERIDFLEKYEPWVTPFQLIPDGKPANWLGRKCVSLLEILRCLSPKCRHVMERASLFEASTASIASLEGIVVNEKPTAIVFGNFDVGLYGLALSLLERQQPYGIIAHGCEISPLPHNKPNDFVTKRVVLKGASWIAANSRHTKSLLDVWRIPSDRLKVINPPISEEAVRVSAVSETVRKNDADLSLVTICRLVKGKGIDIVLCALNILSARGIPFQYVIGGEGPERKSLEALADKLGLAGKVHFKGSVEGDRKWRLLRNADLFVMPSRFDSTVPWRESFGIAFIEAAAFGVPAVGSRTGGIPDAVLDGETGILVPEESPVDLANALTLLYRNPEVRREMGRAARARARTEFTPEIIAARFRELISTMDPAMMTDRRARSFAAVSTCQAPSGSQTDDGHSHPVHI